MVVGHLRCVEDALGLLQRLAADGFYQFGVGGHSSELYLVQAVHRLRTLGIDVVREVLRVHTGIGGKLLLIEALYQVQRHLCGIVELSVTVHL